MGEHSAVSVVVPVFNRASLIESTMNSVLAQTHRPLELVVVDDGSTDDTVKVVQDWSASNSSDALTVRCVQQENLGANTARNRGVTESTASFIAFLDSDDSWLPEKTQKQLAELEADEQIGGVYCGLQTVDLDTSSVHPVTPRNYSTGDLLKQMLIQDVTNPTSCWMVRKSCFDDVGMFDESLLARQDWDLWIRLSSNYLIACVPEVLVQMGEHSGARVRSDPNREISAHKTIFRKYAHLRSRCPFWVSLAARSAMYRRRGRVCLHRKGARLKAAGYQLLAIGIWPPNFDSYAALAGTLLPHAMRRRVHVGWNMVFGKTRLGIRSH